MESISFLDHTPEVLAAKSHRIARGAITALMSPEAGGGSVNWDWLGLELLMGVFRSKKHRLRNVKNANCPCFS